MVLLEKEDSSRISYIVVVAELNWTSKKHSEFYGIEIASLIRLKYKMILPLVVLSFCPRFFFSQQDRFKYNILNVRGSFFAQLPLSTNQIAQTVEKKYPMTEATLNYISTLLINIRYLIDIATHDLRFEKDSISISKSLEKINQQLASTVLDSKINVLSKEILIAHNANKEEVFYAKKKEFIYNLNYYLQQNSDKNFNSEGNSKHKILLLDDNPHDLVWASQALSPYFDVQTVDTAIKAIELIDNDICNELVAIICDWQLLYPDGQHQELLGFEVLEYASMKRFYALFSLTSTDDLSIREVNMELEFDHQLFTKDFQQRDVLWKSYIPIIQQKIDKIVSAIASQPIGEAWENNFKLDYRKAEDGTKTSYKRFFPSFKEQYVKKRNSLKWYQFKCEVDNESTKLWQYYKKAFIEEERFEVFDLKTQWGIELNRELRNFLIIRRLYFAFWFQKSKLNIHFRVNRDVVENPVINIYSVLRMRYAEDYNLGSEDYKKMLNAAKVFANQLSIEPSRLPLGLLPEEKAWLKELNISIDDGNDNLFGY